MPNNIFRSIRNFGDKVIFLLMFRVVNKIASRFNTPINVLVVGDSHAYVFNSKKLRKYTPDIKWDVVAVAGATLSGLSNPNSKTQAMPLFVKALEEKKADAIVFQLGEVDLGFVIYYRSEKEGVDVQEAAMKALNNYKLLVSSAAGKGEAIILSTCLPTISDSSCGDVAHARSSITADQAERTRLTLWFNRELSVWCRAQNISFVDLDRHVLAGDGLVSDYYKNRNPLDHHYNPVRFFDLLESELFPVIRALNC